MVTELVNKNVAKEEFDPLPLKPLPTPNSEERVKGGDINPVSQPAQGLVGWLGSVVNFMSEINWLHTSILLPTPLMALYGLYTVTPSVYTIAWAGFYYFLTGIGITAGYHRLWAHRVFSFLTPIFFQY